MNGLDRGGNSAERGRPPCQEPGCERDAHFRNGYVYCLDDDHVDVPAVVDEPEPEGIATDGFRFFFGASCGSSRKTLRQLEEPNVMLSFATKCNQPWDSIETLMVDSGGYSLAETEEGEYPVPVSAYLDYVEETGADYFMTRDVPAADDLLDALDWSASDAIAGTVEHTTETLGAARDRGLDAQPVAVVQGTTPAEYVQCYHELVSEGAITGRLAIGSLKDHTTAETVEIVRAVRRTIDEDTEHSAEGIELHGLGVEAPALDHPEVRAALDSADSSRYISTARHRANREELAPRLRDDEPRMGWYEVMRAYLDMREDLRGVLDEGDGPAASAHQGTLSGEGWSA